MPKTDRIKVGSHTVEISNAEKVFFPEQGITKGDLIDYYLRIADTMLPYIRERPITMHRFPDGIEGEGFYEKEAPDYFPGWVKRVSVKLKEDGSQLEIVCDNAATLAYLADQACITPHVWLSRADRLNHPDRMILDLDPSGNDFEQVRSAARLLKNLLEEIGLLPFVMTTGSRGLHVVVPLDRSADFDTVRTFAQDAARLLANREPDVFSIEPRKGRRRGRLFLDYLRNAYAQTAVPPYAVRPKPGAPVATPIDWSELTNVSPQQYTIQNIFRRLDRKSDPWKGIDLQIRSLHQPLHQLKALVSSNRSD